MSNGRDVRKRCSLPRAPRESDPSFRSTPRGIGSLGARDPARAAPTRSSVVYLARDRPESMTRVGVCPPRATVDPEVTLETSPRLTSLESLVRISRQLGRNSRVYSQCVTHRVGGGVGGADGGS